LFEFAEAKERADERSEETSLLLCLALHPKHTRKTLIDKSRLSVG
jgi:hypothetical protein